LEHQLTQQALAKKLGVSFTTVNRWFNGKTRPSELQEYQIRKLLHSSNSRSRKSVKAMP